MGRKCSVPECRSGYDPPKPGEPKLSFHAFPKQPDMKRQWERNTDQY